LTLFPAYGIIKGEVQLQLLGRFQLLQFPAFIKSSSFENPAPGEFYIGKIWVEENLREGRLRSQRLDRGL